MVVWETKCVQQYILEHGYSDAGIMFFLNESLDIASFLALCNFLSKTTLSALCYNLHGVGYFSIALKGSEVKGKCFDSYEFCFSCLCKKSKSQVSRGCQWLGKVFL